MTIKQIIRSVAFLAVVCLMLVCLSDLFELDNTTNYDKRLYTYRNLNEDTVDAVYIGTSGVDRYWMSPLAYEDYGMTVYPYSVDGMLTALYINAIEAASINQDLKLVIVDARAFGHTYSIKDTDVCARRQMDALAYLSPVWFRTMKKTVEIMERQEGPSFQRVSSYVFPFMKYHTKWSEKNFDFSENLGSKDHKYAGFFVNSSLSIKSVPQSPVVFNTQAREELDPIAKDSLYELIAYAREEKLELLFVDTPQFMSAKEMARSNTVSDILKKEGFTYLNCNLPEVQMQLQMKMDPAKDYYNDSHTNYYGADTFTRALAAYLDEHYDLPDRRDDKKAQEDWDGTYDLIVERITKMEEKAVQKKD